MRALLPVLTVTTLTLLLAPPSLAQNLAHVGGGAIDLRYAWSIPGASGSCEHERIHLALVHVNSRLAVSAESGTRRAGNGLPWELPASNCPLVITAMPGLWVNPCQLLKGEAPVPATNLVDPYFYSPNSNAYWTKTVTFADGGYATYNVYVRSQPWQQGSFSGSCRSGAATASWTSYHGQIDVGTDPSTVLDPAYGLACQVAHNVVRELPPCPPLP